MLFLIFLEFVDSVYWMFLVFGFNKCGLGSMLGNTVSSFFSFCVRLGSAFLCVQQRSTEMFFPCDKQKNDVTHSCQSVHFERQLCIGVCCPKAYMHLQYVTNIFPLHSTIPASATKHALCNSQANFRGLCNQNYKTQTVLNANNIFS